MPGTQLRTAMALTNTHHAYAHSLDLLRELIVIREQEIHRLKTERDALEAKFRDSQAENESLLSRVRTVERRVQNGRNREDQLVADVTKERNACRDLRTGMQRLNEAHEKLRLRNRDLKGSLKLANTTLDGLTTQINAANRTRDEANRSLLDQVAFSDDVIDKMKREHKAQLILLRMSAESYQDTIQQQESRILKLQGELLRASSSPLSTPPTLEEEHSAPSDVPSQSEQVPATNDDDNKANEDDEDEKEDEVDEQVQMDKPKPSRYLTRTQTKLGVRASASSVSSSKLERSDRSSRKRKRGYKLSRRPKKQQRAK